MPLANYFTLGNAFFGFLALFYLLAADHVDYATRLRIAGLFILISAALDFLDGFVARLTAKESLLGKELDSLSDVLSFGVVPAFIIYQAGGVQQGLAWFLGRLPKVPPSADLLAIILLFGLVTAGLYRLARFNSAIDDPRYFTGLPITATGVIIGFLAVLGGGKWLDNPWVVFPLVAGLSFLMVSKLKIRSLKKVSFAPPGSGASGREGRKTRRAARKQNGGVPSPPGRAD